MTEDGNKNTDDRTRILLADIPGLIEGSNEGKGLGDKFLKHVERTKVLVHVISVETIMPRFGGSKKQLAKAYDVIRQELLKWSEELGSKSEIVVLNKVDMLSASDISALEKYARKELGKSEFTLTSALNGQGIPELSTKIIKLVDKADSKILKNVQKPMPNTLTIANLPNDKIIFRT